MNAFSMREEQIIFKNGWFIYMDGKGNNSIISHKRARELELRCQSYQASMDVDRGGLPDEVAYPSRGFVYKNGRYVYEKFRVDQLIVGEIAPITSVLIIPDSIGGISINCVARQAFQSENVIEKVVLHNNIKEIGESAFEGCINLNEILIPNEHIIIKTDAFKDTAIFKEQDATYINNTLIRVNPSQRGVLEIKKGTTAIADEALKDCSKITEIVLPEGLISIGKNSFRGCSGIRHLVLPESLRVIGGYTFADCTGLQTIVFPKLMDKIGMAAFDGCVALKSVSLPEGILEIERAMFNKCEGLSEVHIPQSVTKIWFDAFTNCGLFKKYENSSAEELYIDNWLIHYKWKEKESLCIREGTIGIAGMNWIKPTKLCSLKLPSSLKYIGDEAFNCAPITSLELPPNLQCINRAAFRGTHLNRIVIPKSVKKIEQWAFMCCENMESIIVEGIETEIVWPAITGRQDKKSIEICAPYNSKAGEYFSEHAQKYNLTFRPYANNI